MYELEQVYLERLEEIAGEIQESEELQNYLENEEEEDFTRLKELFEPKISSIYEEVAAKNPLQLIAFELVLLDPVFEGLFLPKILGYSVLRGEFDDSIKYTRPQEHFKEVLLAICNSTNFDILKKRIGQTIQIGFALSSDIWVTNLINEIENKRIRYFLQSQKLEKYRRDNDRLVGFNRYKRQFQNENYFTARFPEDLSELKVLFPSVKNFLIQRIARKEDNSSIIHSINKLLENEAFLMTEEYLQVLILYVNFFDLEKESKAALSIQFNKTRKEFPEFEDAYLRFLLNLHHNEEIDLSANADNRVSEIIDRNYKDLLCNYYDLTDIIHQNGYTSEETKEAVKVFYNQYPGRSIVNDCVRQTIYHYFHNRITTLTEREYPELFETAKHFPVYMEIFSNQKFNQDLKEICMKYVNKLIKHFTDKRGKDYQDIKKFVSANFPGFGFQTEKEIVELFKTRRKKKPTEA